MSYKEIYELSNELYAERLELVEERIEQIIREPAIEPAFADYFRSVAQCINTIKNHSSENVSTAQRLFFRCGTADNFNIQFQYRYSILSSTNTTSGRLLNRNGIILFPRPRLTTIFVFPSV